MDNELENLEYVAEELYSKYVTLVNPLYYLSSFLYLIDKKDYISIYNRDVQEKLELELFKNIEDYNKLYKISNPDKVDINYISEILAFDVMTDMEVKNALLWMKGDRLDEKTCARIISDKSLYKDEINKFKSEVDLFNNEINVMHLDKTFGSSSLGKYNSVASDIEAIFDTNIYVYDSLYTALQVENKYSLKPSALLITNANLDIQLIRNPFEQVIRDSINDAKLLHRLSPRDFEKYLAEIFIGFGYVVDLTAATRDGGSDIICMKYDNGIQFKLAIEAKRYKDKSISVGMIRQFIGANTQINANKLVYVTTSRYTKDARLFTKSNSLVNLIELKELPDIINWANEYVNLKNK